jgi:hypothetical protein
MISDVQLDDDRPDRSIEEDYADDYEEEEEAVLNTDAAVKRMIAVNFSVYCLVSQTHNKSPLVALG